MDICVRFAVATVMFTTTILISLQMKFVKRWHVLVALAYPVLPSAVLPMFFIAGLLGTLQYLVYGAHRGINLVIWLVRGAWRACAGAVARVCGGGRAPVACPDPDPDAASQSTDGPDGRVGLHAA